MPMKLGFPKCISLNQECWLVVDRRLFGVSHLVKTHTLLVCGSASGHAIPPLIIYPQVRMLESLKMGAPAGAMFATSPKGWINQDILFCKWLDHFVSYAPRERPLLLIYDGHG